MPAAQEIAAARAPVQANTMTLTEAAKSGNGKQNGRPVVRLLVTDPDLVQKEVTCHDTPQTGAALFLIVTLSLLSGHYYTVHKLRH